MGINRQHAEQSDKHQNDGGKRGKHSRRVESDRRLVPERAEIIDARQTHHPQPEGAMMRHVVSVRWIDVRRAGRVLFRRSQVDFRHWREAGRVFRKRRIRCRLSPLHQIPSAGAPASRYIETAPSDSSRTTARDEKPTARRTTRSVLEHAANSGERHKIKPVLSGRLAPPAQARASFWLGGSQEYSLVSLSFVRRQARRRFSSASCAT